MDDGRLWTRGAGGRGERKSGLGSVDAHLVSTTWFTDETHHEHHESTAMRAVHRRLPVDKKVGNQQEQLNAVHVAFHYLAPSSTEYHSICPACFIVPDENHPMTLKDHP